MDRLYTANNIRFLVEPLSRCSSPRKVPLTCQSVIVVYLLLIPERVSETTLRSGRRSALKEDLTGPTLLEMSGKGIGKGIPDVGVHK